MSSLKCQVTSGNDKSIFEMQKAALYIILPNILHVFFSTFLQHDDYTFDGFIRVHMNLTRPVNVSSDVSNLTLKKAVARNKSMNRKPISEIFDIDAAGTGGSATMKSTSDDSGYASSGSFASSESATMVPSGRRARVCTTIPSYPNNDPKINCVIRVGQQL